jgi:hypothetical protein
MINDQRFSDLAMDRMGAARALWEETGIFRVTSI